MRACCVRPACMLCACARAHHMHVRAICRVSERSPVPLTRGKSATGISAASSAEMTISTEGRSFISRAEIRPLVPALDAAAQQGQRGAYAYSAPAPPAPTRSMRAMLSAADAAAEFDDEVAERAHAAARKVGPATAIATAPHAALPPPPPPRTRPHRLRAGCEERGYLAAISPSYRRYLPTITPLSSHRLAGDRSSQEGGFATSHRGSRGAPPRPPRARA